MPFDDIFCDRDGCHHNVPDHPDDGICVKCDCVGFFSKNKYHDPIAENYLKKIVDTHVAFTSELKSTNVRINILHPGLIDSPEIRERISNDVFKHLGKQELLNNKDVAADCIKIMQGQDEHIIFELGQEQQW